jgi:hypothetical protein
MSASIHPKGKELQIVFPLKEISSLQKKTPLITTRSKQEIS